LAEESNGNIHALKQRYLFSALFSAGVMMPMGFEFGLRNLYMWSTPLRRTATQRRGPVAIRGRRFNSIKQRHAVFREESPTNILPCSNPNVMLLWKASATKQP